MRWQREGRKPSRGNKKSILEKSKRSSRWIPQHRALLGGKESRFNQNSEEQEESLLGQRETCWTHGCGFTSHLKMMSLISTTQTLRTAVCVLVLTFWAWNYISNWPLFSFTVVIMWSWVKRRLWSLRVFTVQNLVNSLCKSSRDLQPSCFCDLVHQQPLLPGPG